MGEYLRRVPDFARGGVVLQARANPQREVQKNAETADWVYADEARYLYRMASNFKDRFLDAVLRPDRERLPDPVIAFRDLRNYNTLACYLLVRNPVGLQCEITFNTQHYREVRDAAGKPRMEWRFGRWAQLETLLHEEWHLWQQTPLFGQDPVVPGRVYHNAEFVRKCESVGLHPKLGPGWHTRVADGVFALYMKELGIEPPALEEPIVSPKTDWFKILEWPTKPVGRSSLTLWECECYPPQRARIGKGEFFAECPKCRASFKKIK